MKPIDYRNIAGLYLRAAEKIDADWGPDGHYPCCGALHFVCVDVDDRTTALQAFRRVFKPAGVGEGRLWFGDVSPGNWHRPRQVRNHIARNKQQRIFALLFMHELAKDQLK